MKRFIFLAVALIIFPPAASADIVIFKSGAAKEGIIEEETPTTVKIRVKDAVVGVARSNIEKIEYGTPEENRRLEMKWEDAKRELEEERERRRAEEERFRAEQEAKGYVNVDGEWVTTKEIEARKQEGIRQQIENQQKAAAERKAAESSEEEELPAYIEDLPAEQRELAIEDLRRQSQIDISPIRPQPQGNQTILKGSITNMSDVMAGRIELEIECYDENDELIDVQRQRMANLKPGESRPIYAAVRLEPEMIKRTDAKLVFVGWR